MGKNIGELIREMRKALGISQAALAEKLGVSYQQIQKYEKGGGITVSRLIQIAEAFGVPINTFLGEAEAGQTRPLYPSLSKDELKLIMLYRGLKKKRLNDGFIKMLESIHDLKGR